MDDSRISIVSIEYPSTVEMSINNNNNNMSTKLINEVVKENNELDRDRSTRDQSGFSITGKRRERGDIRSQSYHAEAFREVSIISRRQENLQQGDGEVYSKWTINDQLRLVALDALHAKEKEYHNLIPSADALDVIDIQRAQVSSEDIAAKIVFCSSISEEHNSFYETWQSYNNNTTSKTTPITLSHRHIKNVLSKLSIPEQGNDYIITASSSLLLLLLLLGLLWIQLQDLSTLNDITAVFDLHPVVKLAFTDLRARSTFVPIIPNESFVLTLTFCHLRTNGQHCGIAKLFIYVSKNIVITYESEVLSVSEESDDILGMDFFIYDQEIVNAVNNKLDFLLPELCRYGTTFLLYNVALEGLRLQDQLVEFCSRSISFHKQLVDKVQNDINNSFIFRKVRILESSLVLIKSQIVTSCDVITQCVGVGNDQRIERLDDFGVKSSSSSYSRDPYLKYVLDAFHYVEDTIIRKVDEVQILHADMESLSQLVTARIALLLSLYFSLFVPLNFLTGIFGMNFQANTDNSYSIGILNDPDGVTYFWILCVAVLLMTLSLLVYGGLMKPLEVIKSYVFAITSLFGKSYNKLQKEKEDANREDAYRRRMKSALIEEALRGHKERRNSISRRTQA